MRMFVILLSLLWCVPVWADFLIIDTKTRVVSRITSDNPPVFNSSIETAINVPDQMNIGTGPSKLDVDNKTILPATDADVSATVNDYNPGLVRIGNLKSSINAALADPLVPLSIKSVLTELKSLYQ